MRTFSPLNCSVRTHWKGRHSCRLALVETRVLTCPVPSLQNIFQGLGPHISSSPGPLSSRFLVFPSLGRSLQSALDDNPKHVVSERCMLQVACRLVHTSKPSHILFKPQLPREAEKVILMDAQRAERQWSSLVGDAAP